MVISYKLTIFAIKYSIMGESRVKKSWMNARVNILFYFLSLFFAFFSRKVFLENLSAEFIGLNGTLGSILGYLNLAELGIGSAISCFLFKPIEQKDKSKIVEIISLYGYFYRKIGTFIGITGIIVSLFFPLIFGKTALGLGIVYFSFYCFLGSSLIGYFVNYRQILLTADQKNYVVSAYFQTAGIIKTGIQILLAYKYKNLYLWASVEFIFGVFACIVLNWKINKVYPWLNTNIAQGKTYLIKYPEILRSTKQIFIHTIKDFILTKSDEIFIFAFVSLKMVAFYGNYVMIINKILVLVTSVLDGMSSGVGNLVAEDNIKNTIKVFWELMSIRYFIAGCVVFSLFQLINPFIILWLGKQYILGNTILLLLMINLFISETRGIVDMFNHAYGHYADVWTAWVELFLNLSITISVGYFYGIIGILLGKIISTFVIIVIWKPYYLFSSGFKLPVSKYWNNVIKYYIAFFIAFIAAKYITGFIDFHSASSYVNWCLCAIISIFLFVIIYMPLLFMGKGTKDFAQRMIGYLKIWK